MTSPQFTSPDGTVDPDLRERVLAVKSATSPLRATGETTDITYAMLYLATDASRFTTGQTMRPNGGVFMA